MKIFVAGGGRVGGHLARLLCADKHSVVVLEQEDSLAQQLENSLDLRAVVGNAASVELLRDEEVDQADVFVSVTGNDEVNLIAAAAAKSLGAKVVVARVDDEVYASQGMLYETVMGIDYIMSPAALTALEIVKYIENPGIVATEEFGRGRVQMRQMRLTKALVKPEPLKQMKLPVGVLIGAINRRGHSIIPDGNAVLELGDLVTVVGPRDQVAQVQRLFHTAEARSARVAIMGGSDIGFHMAQVLDHRKLSVKLFEWNQARCAEISAELHRVEVVHRDGTSRQALMEEGVDKFDVFVATTDDDERNIVSCVLAKEVGAAHTVAVISQPDFASLVGRLGIDHIVTPRACLSNRVLRLVHQKSVSTLAVLDEGQVEVLEFQAREGSPVLGKPLRDVHFPNRALVATIVRGDEVKVPRGNDAVHAGDSVILIAAPDSIDSLQRLFQG